MSEKKYNCFYFLIHFSLDFSRIFQYFEKSEFLEEWFLNYKLLYTFQIPDYSIVKIEELI
jgi:hypothetical protein